MPKGCNLLGMQTLQPANQSVQAIHKMPTLTVNLGALCANYQTLANTCAPAECGVVVKANAYGLGMDRVAPALYEAGAKSFFVATLEGGAYLRDILPDATIYVLNGLLNGDQDLLLTGNLTPVINTMESLHLWQAASKLAQKPLPFALHVDTGLNRLGLSPDEFQSVLNTGWDGLDLKMVMSHLACADEPDHPMTKQQSDLFNTLTKDLPQTVQRSLAASDGAFRGQHLHHDLVRAGASLYGLNPTLETENPMQPVVQLNVPILQIRTVEQDGTAGYCATASVKKGQRLAVVAYGYADGLYRSASNSAKLFYGGQALPVVGRVSMDVTIVDISDLPEGTLKQGDMLQVFGANQAPDDLARDMDTIGYEILTSIGYRIQTTYI